ncbi:MAG: S-layer homology domain-containing protein [Firmicutes bacterium]|nr:S-layer homology domain-containing protein [Bacillota bacterium]
MKAKLLSCITVVLTCVICFPIIGGAMGNISANIKYDYVEDGIKAEGVVVNELPGLMLTLKITDSTGKIVGVSQTRTLLNERKQVAFSFPAVMLKQEVLSGNLEVSISGHLVGTTAPFTVKHIGSELMLDILREVNAITSSSFEEVILEKAGELNADTASYTKLKPDGKVIFRTLMYGKVYDIPAGSQTEQDKKKITGETARFLINYKYALNVALFTVINTQDDFAEWYCANFEAYAMDKDDPATDLHEEMALQYLNQMKSAPNFLSRIKNVSGYKSMNEIKDYIFESALLTFIHEAHYREVRTMMETFPAVFGVNSADFGKLPAAKQGECYSKFAGKPYATYKAAGDELNRLIKEMLDGSGSTPAPQGGRGSSQTVAFPTVTPDPNADIINAVPDNNPKPLYTDMASAEWAKEAVEVLSARQIVSGKGGGIFAPNDLVTRAEFTKMLMLSLSAEIDENAASDFNDISASDWFALYVAAAQREGIAMGNDRNEFEPNSPITRQDMVVLLYRAMRAGAPQSETAEFRDWGDVSDYARDAVIYLYEKGYVKGIGDGIFGARQNTTRAQAAQILFNLIK